MFWRKIREIKIKIMISIRETKWARIAILENILDIEAFGHTGMGRKKESNPLFISDCIELNGFTYAIDIALFRNIMENLESEKTIKITQLDLHNVVDCVADNDEYMLARAREKFNLSAEEIKSEKTVFCGFIVENIEKIKKEITRLNSMGVSLETLKNNFLKTNQQKRNGESLEKKQASPNFIVKKGNDYFFKESLIYFGENTQYKDLFDIIYSNCLQENFISYEDINKKLIEKGWKNISQKKVNKRIQNAIKNGIFKFAKLENKKLKNSLSNGKKILEIIRGKGIKLNNV